MSEKGLGAPETSPGAPKDHLTDTRISGILYSLMPAMSSTSLPRVLWALRLFKRCVVVARYKFLDLPRPIRAGKPQL